MRPALSGASPVMAAFDRSERVGVLLGPAVRTERLGGRARRTAARARPAAGSRWERSRAGTCVRRKWCCRSRPVKPPWNKCVGPASRAAARGIARVYAAKGLDRLGPMRRCLVGRWSACWPTSCQATAQKERGSAAARTCGGRVHGSILLREQGPPRGWVDHRHALNPPRGSSHASRFAWCHACCFSRGWTP